MPSSGFEEWISLTSALSDVQAKTINIRNELSSQADALLAKKSTSLVWQTQ